MRWFVPVIGSDGKWVLSTCLCGCCRQYNSEFEHLKTMLSKTTQEHYQLIIRAVMRTHNKRKNNISGLHLLHSCGNYRLMCDGFPVWEEARSDGHWYWQSIG